MTTPIGCWIFRAGGCSRRSWHGIGADRGFGDNAACAGHSGPMRDCWKRDVAADREPGDLTREPLTFPADRDVRLQALARGDEGFLLGHGLFDPARLWRHPSVRRRDPHGRGLGRNRTAGAWFRHRHRRPDADRVPDGQPVQGLEDRAAAVHPRLWSGVRVRRTQGDGDGVGRSRDARRGTGRGRRPPRRRTSNSCCITPTISRRPASSSI